jgi:type III HopA1-like effector protein
MNEHYENVARCIRETVIHSQTNFTSMGQPCARLAPRIRRAMTAKTARSYLVYQLQSRLYGEFYMRGNRSGSNWSQAPSNDAISFARVLSCANVGGASLDTGWTVVKVNADEAVVRKGGLQLHVQTAECIATRDGPLQAGSTVTLQLPKELLSASPGYYMALGNRGEIGAKVSPLVRLYWNLRADGAVTFVESFTRHLNEAGIYFRLKVLNDPAAYTRSDAGVLYFNEVDKRCVSGTVSAVYGSIAPFLNGDVPMFTRRIAPGLGLAEDPGTQESFGQHRCRILAEGIIRAHEEQAKSLQDRLRIVESQFASEGIRLSQPHLNPRSEDHYTFTHLG